MANNSSLCLHYIPESGPCRTVMLMAKVLGIDLNFKRVELFQGQHMTPEFLKMNPMHAVPVLTDGDFSLGESRAIIIYLVEKYGKSDTLYPRDPKVRAKINSLLFFDIDILYRPILDHYKVLYLGSKELDDKQLPLIKNALDTLNTILNGNKYVTGDNLTVADISIVSSISTAIAVYNYDITPFANVDKWYRHLKQTLPDFDNIIVRNAMAPGDHFKTLCLYYTPESPVCRNVMLTAKILNLDLNMIHVDMSKGDHMKREYLKINPQHQVPSLTDNTFTLAESRAIMIYLTEKYGKTEDLYPRDVKKRAKINQFLYFDLSLLNSILSYFFGLFQGTKKLDESKREDAEKQLKVLDKFLDRQDYLVGDRLTLADIAMVSTVATALLVNEYDLKAYGNILKWYNNLKATLPQFEEIIEENCQKQKAVIEYFKSLK